MKCIKFILQISLIFLQKQEKKNSQQNFCQAIVQQLENNNIWFYEIKNK